MINLKQNASKYLSVAGVAVFLALIVIGFYLLHISKTGASIQIPWQAIHPAYIYVFFGATLILGLLIIFSKLKTVYLLILLVIFSFLLHSYLPLTHDLLYGADNWRHIANEEQILQGHWPIKPILREGAVSPKVDVGDFAYGGFWVLSAGVSKISGLSLIAVNKWLGPILWSLFFPILLFFIVKKLGNSDKQGLLTVWLASLPFALQSAGSFTLPVNLGLLIWLAGLILILNRLNNPNRKQIKWLVLFGVLSVFNYTLYFILFWLAWLIGELVFGWIKRSGGLSLAIAALIGFFATVGLVAAEWLGRYSNFAPINWFGQLKQLVGNFSGWYLAFGPRPHDISVGNIIFNQAPSYAFVPNLFTASRGWVVAFMIVFLVAVVWGAILMLTKNRIAVAALSLFAVGLLGSYIISRYFMAGENILARRLDAVLALFMIFFAAAAINHFFTLFSKNSYIISCLIIFFLSFAIAASYSLGPDTNTVSAGEYHLMQGIWDEEKNITANQNCVLADTYPLLALEAISAKKIVGGNFPIDANFAQPERERIYYNFRHNVSSTNKNDDKLLSSFLGCWYVENGQDDILEKFNQIDKFFSRSAMVIFGNPEAVLFIH